MAGLWNWYIQTLHETLFNSCLCPLSMLNQNQQKPTSQNDQPETVEAIRAALVKSSTLLYPPYQNTLNQSGYTDKLSYTQKTKSTPKKKNRSRNIIWFNPPYRQSVKTNIAAKFYSLIDKHFGKSNLNKYFNIKTIKLSRMPNIEAVISGHNRKLLNHKPIPWNPLINLKKTVGVGK